MSKRSRTEANDHKIDQLSMDAPTVPTHRPPTKREVWDRYSFIYGDVKPPEELSRFCRDAWMWSYVSWVNFKGWRRHPDWKDGDPIIYEAVRKEPFPPDQGYWTREINRLYDIVKQHAHVLAAA